MQRLTAEMHCDLGLEEGLQIGPQKEAVGGSSQEVQQEHSGFDGHEGGNEELNEGRNIKNWKYGGEVRIPGSPLIPTLFIVCMDTYTDTADKNTAELEHKEHSSNWEVVLIAMDIKLQAATPGTFQQLLNVSAIWALPFAIKWKNGKRKLMDPITRGMDMYSDWRTRICK